MTLYLLCTTRSGTEFQTADAINAMLHRPDPDGDLRSLGAVAIVPRRIVIIPANDGKPASWDYRPFLPNYIFLVMEELIWSRILHRNRDHLLRDGDHILAPPSYLDDILPRTWASVQDFAHRAEVEAQRQIDKFESGFRVTRYSQGDKLRILGDLMDGQLKGRFAHFVRMHKGKAVVQVEGMTLMGKPIMAHLEPQDIGSIAAE